MLISTLLHLPAQDVHCAWAVRIGSHVGATVESGWDFLTPYVFLKNSVFVTASGLCPRCPIGTVNRCGDDELQYGFVPAESAGGFRADPADRKRHLRRCVQGRVTIGVGKSRGVPLSDRELWEPEVSDGWLWHLWQLKCVWYMHFKNYVYFTRFGVSNIARYQLLTNPVTSIVGHTVSGLGFAVVFMNVIVLSNFSWIYQFSYIYQCFPRNGLSAVEVL